MFKNTEILIPVEKTVKSCGLCTPNDWSSSFQNINGNFYEILQKSLIWIYQHNNNGAAELPILIKNNRGAKHRSQMLNCLPYILFIII